MLEALKAKISVDVCYILTDSETWQAKRIPRKL